MKPSALIKKAGWVTAGDIVFKSMSFAISILLARTLGVEQYGWVTIGFSMLGYAVWFTDLGMIQIGTRDAAKPPAKRQFAIATYFNTRAMLGIIVFGTGFSAILLMGLPADKTTFYSLILLSAIPHALLLQWFFSGRQHFNTLTISRVLQNGVYLLFLLIFLKANLTPIGVGIAYLSGVSIAALYMIWKFPSKSALLTPLPSKKYIHQVLKHGLTIGTGNIMTQVVLLLPPLVLGYYLGEKQAGLYGVAFKLVLGAMMLDYIFNTLYLPILSKASATTNRKQLDEKLTRLTKLMGFAAVLAGFTLYSLAPSLIPLLFGQAYAPAVPLLKILCWFVTFTLINSIFTFGLIAFSRDRAYWKTAFYGGSVSGGLIITAAVWGNMHWVAWSVLAGECLIMLLRYGAFKKVAKVRIGLLFSAVFLCMGIVQLIPHSIIPNALFHFLIGLLVITAIFMSMQLLKREDIIWLKHQLFKESG